MPVVSGGIQHEFACALAAAAAAQQVRRPVAARTCGLEDGFLDGPATQALPLPGCRRKTGEKLLGRKGRRGRCRARQGLGIHTGTGTGPGQQAEGRLFAVAEADGKLLQPRTS